VIHEAVLRDCKGDETHAAKVTAAFIVAEFCKVLKSGRTAATEAAAHSNEEALTLMRELGMHLDTPDCNGDTPHAASGRAAAAPPPTGLLRSGTASGDAAAAKITAMLLQPGVPQPAVDYPVSNKDGQMSLGAEAAQRQWPKSPVPCLRRLQHASAQMCRSMARPVKKPANSTELARTRHSGAATAAEDDPTKVRGWSVFDEESGAASANEQNPGALHHATLNPMSGGRGGADTGFRSADPCRFI
jgi:hypothetical protein